MLYKFKKIAQETSDRQKEKLQSSVDILNKDLAMTVQLFLACGDEVVSYIFPQQYCNC